MLGQNLKPISRARVLGKSGTPLPDGLSPTAHFDPAHNIHQQLTSEGLAQMVESEKTTIKSKKEPFNSKNGLWFI